MQLCAEAAVANMGHAPNKAGVEMPRSQQAQESRLWICARNHRVRAHRLARFESDAASAVAFHHDTGHRRSGTQGRPGRPRRFGQRIAERAHPALGLGQSRRARRFRRQPVQQRQHRAGRAWAEVGAEHGIEAERALQRRRFEVLLEQVMDIHAADAQQFTHVATSQLAYLPTHPEQRQAVGPSARSQTRRHTREDRCQRAQRNGACAPYTPHTPANPPPTGAARRPPRSRSRHVAIGQQRRGAHALRRPLQTVRFQPQIAQ